MVMRMLMIMFAGLLLASCQPEAKKAGALQITADVDKAVIEGNAISWQARTSYGASAHHVWSIASGTLPPGFVMTPNGNSIMVTGSSNAPGDYPVRFRAEVGDKDTKSDTHEVVFTVAPLTGPLTIYTTVVPDTLETASYAYDIVITGGTGTGYTFAIIAGALPQNYSVVAGPDGARLIGSSSPPGDYTFTLEVTDSAANVATATFTLTLEENIGYPA